MTSSTSHWFVLRWNFTCSENMMNVASVASNIALQAIAQQNATQPTLLAAAVAAPQTDALALTDAASAVVQADLSALGSAVDTYA
jgi:hypothetical protein